LQQGSQKKPSPAKIEAWKMWQNDGLSFGEIAVSLFFPLLFSFFLIFFLHKILEDLLFLKTCFSFAKWD
jgi:hypothetical protein